MTRERAASVLTLASLVALAALLAWLDSARGGPATVLSRCNLALARSDAHASDVLLIGSSRSGVAFDPVAIQDVLQRTTGRELTVDRIAIGNMTLRLSEALLETYVQRRGAPEVVVLEPTVMTPRTVRRVAPKAGGEPPEHYLLARDRNLMTFAQLITQAAVAMPYTESETALNLWHFRLRGVVSRAGTLLYQFARAPFESWTVESCDRADVTRESTWPEDFSFAYDEYRIDRTLAQSIAGLREQLIAGPDGPELDDWQREQPQGRAYPYDFNAAYRRGEMAYFRKMMGRARSVGAGVLVVPMPLYGYAIEAEDLASLKAIVPGEVQVFDVYGEIGRDFRAFWYDDAHIEKFPAGALTTTLLARELVSLFGESVNPD